VPNEDPIAIAGFVSSDRQFAEEMESRLSPGAMVFQLPVMDFPESPIPGVPSYNHFRPYIYTKALRYSFGDVKGKARNAWQNEVALLPPEELMQQLERYGFGALYINRNGYADGGKAYLDAAADRAATVLESPKRDLVCILLHPSSTAVLPPPGPHFGEGWAEVQRNNPTLQVRGGKGHSQIVLTNPEEAPIERYLQFVIQGVDEREMTLDYNGNATPFSLKPGVGMRVENLKVQLKPGRNVLSFDTAKPPIQTGHGPLAFHLVNFRMTDRQIEPAR
jgi:phosphoglycerol transferase